MADKTLFERIIEGEIPADIVYTDDKVIAFNDISPQSPVHILIVPRKPIPTVNDVEDVDDRCWAACLPSPRSWPRKGMLMQAVTG